MADGPFACVHGITIAREFPPSPDARGWGPARIPPPGSRTSPKVPRAAPARDVAPSAPLPSPSVRGGAIRPGRRQRTPSERPIWPGTAARTAVLQSHPTTPCVPRTPFVGLRRPAARCGRAARQAGERLERADSTREPAPRGGPPDPPALTVSGGGLYSSPSSFNRGRTGFDGERKAHGARRGWSPGHVKRRPRRNANEPMALAA
jgi:hypothetical protein